MKRWMILIAFAVLSVAWAPPAAARIVAPSAGAVPRTLLALYDGRASSQAESTLLHQVAAMPLEHLGYLLELRDVHAPLPDAAGLARYAAVITWFEAPLRPTHSYLSWASEAAARGTRFIILGEPGGDPYSGDLDAMNGLLAALGLRHTGQLAAPTIGAEVAQIDHSLVGFERKLDVALPPFPIFAVDERRAVSALRVAPGRRSGLAPSTLVSTGPGGGFAATGYELYRGTDAGQRRWIIDPFVFFERALGARRFPVPDTTTLSGRRMFLTVVESDAAAATVETGAGRGASAAAIVERDLVAPFLEFPQSVLMDQRSEKGARMRVTENWSPAHPHVETMKAPASLAAGGTLIDASSPSIAGLAPLGRYVNGRWLTNVPATNVSRRGEWTGEPSFALAALIAHMRATGAPRRLTPSAFLYATTAGRQPAAIGTIRAFLQAARTMRLIGVRATAYEAIVQGFKTARIDEIGALRWVIRDRGALQTVRFDDAGGLTLDRHASRGVVGQARHNGALYVALDATYMEPVVGLLPASSVPAPDDTALLDDSSWTVRSLVRDGCGLRFEAAGFGPGAFAWRGLRPGFYHIKVQIGAETVWQGRATLDGQGRLTFEIPVAATQPASIAIACAGDAM